MKQRKIGQYLFIAILVLHVLGCYIMGGIILTDTKTALETGFGITFNDELEILGLVIGLELLFLGSIALLGIIWTRKGKIAGLVVGSSVGMYMLIFGIASFIKYWNY